MEHVPTGIAKLDEMIGDGLKENSITLISGGCGSGKSIFDMDYKYKGVVAGENKLYVSFEENDKDLKENMSSFGWDIEEMEVSGKIKIVRIPQEDVMRLVKDEYSELKDYSILTKFSPV